MRRRRWACFISGTGSNLGALIETSGIVDVRLVVSSRADAWGILKARRAGIPVQILDKKIDWEALLQQLEKFSIDGIFLAGFMRIVPEYFIQKFNGVIFNLHPSLLPAYPGLNSIERAYQEHQPLGATVHHVVPEVDAGKIILQRKTERYPDLEISEFLLHLSEQRLVREAIQKC